MLAAAVVLLALAADPEPGAPALGVGSVAQGVLDPAASGVVDRWRAALRDARPEVRAAAARAINVTGLASLGPDVVAALREESVDEVAVELIRAAVTLRAVDDAALVSALRSPRQAAALARHLLRARGPSTLATFLAPLRKAGFELAAPTLEALIGVPGLRERVAREALDGNDAALWQAVLLPGKGAPLLGEGLLAAGLRAPGEGLREPTLWYVAQNAGRATSDAAATRRLLSIEAPPGASLGERLARELTERALGTPPRDVPGWLESLKSKAAVMPKLEISDPEVQRRFTKRELEALRAHLGVKELPRHSPLSSPSASNVPSEAAMWVMTGFPTGYRSAVLQATGCQPAKDVVGAAEVQWTPSGRLRSMTLLPDRLSPGCRDAFKILAKSSLVPDWLDEVPATTAVLFGVLDPELLTCQDEPPPATPPRKVDGASHIDEPKKLRSVPPTYPEAVKQAHIQGVVVLEALISTSGCVQDLRVVHTEHPGLAWAAMKAVLQWRYSPTLLNGVAVPVVMTVTVNFRLS